MTSAILQDALWDAPLGLAFFDAELRCVGVSRAFTELAGLPAERCVGCPAEEVLPDWPAVAAAVTRARDGGAREDVDAESGRRCWRYQLFPVRGSGAGALVRDVTNLRRDDDADGEREAWFRSIVETIPHMVWVGDPARGNVYNNRRLIEYTGVDPEALLGDGWTRALHPDDADTALAVWRRAQQTGAPFVLVERVRRYDGEYRCFLAAGAPLRGADGRVLRWIGTWTDIHERVVAEQELRQADRRKDEFLGVLSHELRNPLAPIRNAISILERADPAAETARRAKEVLGRQVAYLTRLIDDLLDVTRISRGKMELRRGDMDLGGLVRRVVDDHRSELEGKGLQLVLDAPPDPVLCDGDETRLAQVVGNLLHNALKFTPSGGRLWLALAEREGVAEIRMRDEGMGIEGEVLGRVFEPFVQGRHALALASGGLGLGLALVRGIVALHGGTVEASSEGRGRGAEFVVRLPALSRPPRRETRTRATPGVRRRRVLVVDDNADAASTLADLVQMFGHEADVAHDAPAALRLARERVPDVLLCDLGLPGMSGYDLAEAFREDAALRQTRLIAVSGYALLEDRQRTADAGFVAHVAKPPDARELERLLGE